MSENEPVERKEEYWITFAQSFDDDQEYVAGKSSIKKLMNRKVIILAFN